MLTLILFPTDEECFRFQQGDDSGLSSCPSTPTTTEDNESLSDIFDLSSSLCDSLNLSLFDGDLPNKLLTHIKIKTDDDVNDELWQPVPGTPSCIVNNSSSFLDSLDFGVIDELFGPTVDPRDIFKAIEKPSQRDIVSSEILADVTNSVTSSNISSTVAEVGTTPRGTPEEIQQNIFKRELRTRRKRVQLKIDHDYCKSADLNDSEDEFKADEESDEVSDDDEDYTAPYPAKKSRKTNSNSVEKGKGKDAKYWERRQRNNLAAKRSREAKRAREIQIAKKSVALEKENANLKKLVRKLKADIKKAEKKLRIMI